MVYAAHVPEVQENSTTRSQTNSIYCHGPVVLLFALGMVKSDIAGGTADGALAAPLDRMIDVLLTTRQVRACFR